MARSATLNAALAVAGIAPCGDNSCWFGSPGGMATNGGCRCAPRGRWTPEEHHEVNRLMRKMAHAIVALAKRAEAAEAQVCRLTTSADIESDHLCPHACEIAGHLATIADLRADAARWRKVAPLIERLRVPNPLTSDIVTLLAVVTIIAATQEPTP